VAKNPTPVPAEERARIVEEIVGHTFSDKSLIEQAFTHPSAVEANPLKSYERLEFLGDAVVGLCVAEYAFTHWPDLREGDLTKMRVAVVNGTFLAEKQAEQGFSDLIVFGASELGQSARGMNSALEDSFESLVGALYLDAGFDVASRWVLGCLGSYVNPDVAVQATNPKSELQEIVQKYNSIVEYRIINSSGPAHAPKFVAEVLIDGEPRAQAKGASKKEAEAAAAAEALRIITGVGASPAEGAEHK
jgi:ribonuclease-3